MINFSVHISNPFATDSVLPPSLHWCKSWSVTPNRFLELELFRTAAYNWVRFELGLAWRGSDHAGPHIELELFGLHLRAILGDYRHWDYKEGTWESHGQD